MDALVIGGTRFLGRHLVESLLADGHAVTLFTRGRTNPGLFPSLDHRIGDRDGGLDALGDDRWDVVFDTCGYTPRVVRASAERLAGRTRRYVFVSTISVYADDDASTDDDGPDEEVPVGAMDDPANETVDGTTYGPLKALCEAVVRAAYGDAGLIVRPGVIVGPHDPTDRFTYWLARIAAGGPFAVPEGPAAPLQYIDARDLAGWLVRAARDGVGGTFNAVGPRPPATFGDLVRCAVDVAGSSAAPVWVSPEALAAAEVRPWSDMPMWLPSGHRALMHTRSDRAVAAGLTFRPLAETIADTLAWHRGRPNGTDLAAGLSADREAALLATLGANDAT